MERTGTGTGSLHFVIGSHRDVDVEVLVGTDVSILLQEELLVVASIQEGSPVPNLFSHISRFYLRSPIAGQMAAMYHPQPNPPYAGAIPPIGI